MNRKGKSRVGSSPKTEVTITAWARGPRKKVVLPVHWLGEGAPPEVGPPKRCICFWRCIQREQARKYLGFFLLLPSSLRPGPPSAKPRLKPEGKGAQEKKFVGTIHPRESRGAEAESEQDRCPSLTVKETEH